MSLPSRLTGLERVIKGEGARAMAQKVKAFVSKPNNVTLTPRTH